MNTDKPTIEQALKNKLPLPWKQSTCDGPPQWAVVRQRPEDFTAEIYAQMKKYGCTENEIREAFHISNAFYAKTKSDIGVLSKHGLAAWMAEDEDKPYLSEHSPTGDSTQIPPEANRHLLVPARELKKIKVTKQVQEAPEELTELTDQIVQPNGKDSVSDIHQPSLEEVEKFFEEVTGGLAKDQCHYNATGQLQPIEVMQIFLPAEQFLGFLRGNVIKYSCRAGRKDDAKREVDKVIQYALWWRKALDGKTINPREV